jgi:hypothetical protein
VARDRPGELGEKALDEVEPGVVLGCQVNSKAPGGRVASQAPVPALR